jgi:hypothetical protein
MLRNVPQQILITQLIYLLECIGHFQLLVYLRYPLLHLLLLGFESFQGLLHLLIAILDLLHLLLVGRSQFLLLLLDFLQLLHILLMLLLQPLDLLVFCPFQLLLQLFHLFT